MSVADEISANFGRFQKKWWDEAAKARAENLKSSHFDANYRLLAGYNALRENVLREGSNGGALDFFLEAQNDGLTSIILAELGVWRASLQALRSLVENTLNGLYFLDHPVELIRWTNGSFKTSFSELQKYFSSHPTLEGVPSNLNGMNQLGSEYATLSKAVHGSARTMRMSADGAVNLSSSELARLGSWNTRFTKTARACLILIIALRNSKLTGAQNLGTRATLALCLTGAQKAGIKTSLKVSLIAQ